MRVDDRTVTVELVFVPDKIVVKTWDDDGKPLPSVAFVREPLEGEDVSR